MQHENGRNLTTSKLSREKINLRKFRKTNTSSFNTNFINFINILLIIFSYYIVKDISRESDFFFFLLFLFICFIFFFIYFCTLIFSSFWRSYLIFVTYFYISMSLIQSKVNLFISLSLSFFSSKFLMTKFKSTSFAASCKNAWTKKGDLSQLTDNRALSSLS